MNKKIAWVLFVLALIGVNVFAIPIATWSTFAGSEEMKYFWMIGGFLLWVLLNIGVIQLVAAIKQALNRFFWIGLTLILLQIIGMYLLYSFMLTESVTLFMILITMIGSIVLLIMQAFKNKTRAQ